jgi:hypothetical protein
MQIHDNPRFPQRQRNPTQKGARGKEDDKERLKEIRF